MTNIAKFQPIEDQTDCINLSFHAIFLTTALHLSILCEFVQTLGKY